MWSLIAVLMLQDFSEKKLCHTTAQQTCCRLMSQIVFRKCSFHAAARWWWGEYFCNSVDGLRALKNRALVYMYLLSFV